MSNRKRFAVLISTWFGCGFLKPAPGTIGSLAALPFAWLLYETGGFQIFLIATIILFFVGVWSANNSNQTFIGDDPAQVVVDEVVGQWATLLVVEPFNIVYYLLGFVLFRIFDIFKPWPISWVEKKIKGGLGIMLDDIFAAIYAGTALFVIQTWLQLDG